MNHSPPAKKITRLNTLDCAKGLGIFLVVVGHIVARDFPNNVQWYPLLKSGIYLFHMPFFMFVSGAIAGYTWRPVESLPAYLGYIKKKAMRLLPAYMLFAGLVFFGKMAASELNIGIDNPVKSPLDFLDVLLYPTSSYSAFLWYIWTLFIIYVITPVFLHLFRNPIVLLLMSFALQFVPTTQLFGLHLVSEYLFVFFLGLLIFSPSNNSGARIESFFLTCKQALPVSAFLFASALILSYSIPNDFAHIADAPFNFKKSVCGLLSIPTLMALIEITKEKFFFALESLGKYTFSIYLMNTIAIGTTKAILNLFFNWHGVNFYWYAMALLAAGIVGPIVVKKVIFTRFRFLDRITN